MQHLTDVDAVALVEEVSRYVDEDAGAEDGHQEYVRVRGGGSYCGCRDGEVEGYGHCDYGEEPENLEDARAVIEETPLKRLGAPEEVANAAVYLASDESDFVTGELHMVTGGRGIH